MSFVKNRIVPNGLLCESTLESIILQPYEHLVSSPGKGLRNELIAAVNYWLQVPEERLTIITGILDLLYNASLILDDIEDHSELRRGKPAAHCVYGTASSINSANYAYFLALDKLSRLNNPEAVSITTEQMLEFHRGQGMDIFWRSSFRCPSESEYMETAMRKIGAPFGLGLRLMQLYSENKTDFSEIVKPLSILFQIRDDYANLVDPSYHQSKTYAEDLTEGKFSFPVIYCIQSFPQDNLVASILSQHTKERSVKEQCVRHMAELGALDYTVNILFSLEQRCYELIESHGGNVLLCEFLKKLGLIYRTSDGQLRRHHPKHFHHTNQSNSI